MTTTTITFTKPNGTPGTKAVPPYRATEVAAQFTAYGYTNVEIVGEATTFAGSAPVATAKPAVVKARTGRTKTGKVVHELVLNSAKCGASFRRNRIGNTVQVTGEPVTCQNCL